jgi:DNA end-binding protein Ku
MAKGKIMTRPIWKGYITFGLVSVPIILYSAEKKSDIPLHLVDARDKSRIHYLRINESTGEEVPWEEIAKGYEYVKNHFIVLNDKDLKKIAGKNAKVINIESFVEKGDLDFIDFYKPYYIVPDTGGEKGYVILRETLNQTQKIGISKVIIHSRQYLAALMPHKNALLLNLMHYSQEIIKPSEFELPSKDLKSYKITAKEVEVAKQLINLMTSPWKPENYQDEYQHALQQWLKEKVQSKKPKTQMKSEAILQPKGTIINFVDLLKKSLETKQGKKEKNRKKVQSKSSATKKQKKKHSTKT